LISDFNRHLQKLIETDIDRFQTIETEKHTEIDRVLDSDKKLTEAEIKDFNTGNSDTQVFDCRWYKRRVHKEAIFDGINTEIEFGLMGEASSDLNLVARDLELKKRGLGYRKTRVGRLD